MYKRPLRPDELAHFGIKGMQWGVRRYQNEDGSLTPAGKERYYNNKNYDDEYQDKYVYTKHGYDKPTLYGARWDLKKGEKFDTLKKGSHVYRYTYPDEKLSRRPIYASFTGEDARSYSEMGVEGMLRLDQTKHGYGTMVQYELQKDIKIVKSKEICDHILSKYKDTKVEDIPAVMRTNGREIVNHYKDLNYDAITDVEDYVTGVGEYPIILLNPKEQLKKKQLMY